MKILFISTKGPLPTNDGHCLRTFNLLREVARHHEVFLLSFVKFEEEYRNVEQLRQICSHVEYLPLRENTSRFHLAASLVRNIFSDRPFVVQKYETPEMRESIRRVLKEEIDLVHLDMLPSSVIGKCSVSFRLCLISTTLNRLFLPVAWNLKIIH